MDDRHSANADLTVLSINYADNARCGAGRVRMTGVTARWHKPPKSAYTLACTPQIGVYKLLKNILYISIRTSHNPLVLGSNPSGPSLPAKTDSQPIGQAGLDIAGAKPPF